MFNLMEGRPSGNSVKNRIYKCLLASIPVVIILNVGIEPIYSAFLYKRLVSREDQPDSSKENITKHFVTKSGL